MKPLVAMLSLAAVALPGNGYQLRTPSDGASKVAVRASQVGETKGAELNQPGQPIDDMKWNRVPDFDQGVEGSDPHVLKVGGVYLMYVSRKDSTRKVSTTWLWQSADGMKWAPKGQVLDVGPKGSWDETNAEVPTVLHEDGRYRLWYGGAKGLVFQIGYAESWDGLRFRRLPREESPYGIPGLVLAPDDRVDGSLQSVADPSVLRVKDTYYLYFSGFATNALTISLATSNDGLRWERRGVVLRPDRPWEMANEKEGTVAQPSVVFDGATFHMAYGAFSGTGHDVRAIGYASSGDGLRWIKSQAPILEPTGSEKLFTGSCLLIDGDSLNLYYAVWKPNLGVRLARARRPR